MTRCENCDEWIIFGGKREGNARFCNHKCLRAAQEQSQVLRLAEQIPDDLLADALVELQPSGCPRCGGPGPVELYVSHTAWSPMFFTFVKNHPKVTCLSCAQKRKMVALLVCLLFGWWGLPAGVIVTPVQIVRNLRGIFTTPDPENPSDELIDTVRWQLASEISQEEQPTEQAM